LLVLALLLSSPTQVAHATEVQFEGFYRTRMSMFDTLSLDRNLANSEGLTWYATHRLWLRPKFLISDRVGVYADIRGLDGVHFGDQPGVYDNGLDNHPPVFEHSLTAPTSTTDADTVLSDFTLWRAWGDVDTQIGRFRFGRVPLHWGTGIWLNDGLSVAPDLADHGDSADRIQWEYLIQDEFWISAGVDANAEGFINETDDTTSFHAAVAYRSEQVTAGITSHLQRAPSRDFNLFTLDGAVDAELGKLELHGEFLRQFGGGDLENGLNQVTISAFGAAIDGKLHADPLGIRLQGGLATGDKEDGDASLKVFTFDRDYSVGTILFEQPMPILAASAATDANAGRDTQTALTGTAVSNALYLKPTISRELVDGLHLEGSWLGARVAKLPDRLGDRKSYGNEFDLAVRYNGIEHFDTSLTFGTFLPGSYYRNYADDTYDAFDDPVFAGQLVGRIRF